MNGDSLSKIPQDELVKMIVYSGMVKECVNKLEEKHREDFKMYAFEILWMFQLELLKRVGFDNYEEAHRLVREYERREC